MADCCHRSAPSARDRECFRQSSSVRLRLCGGRVAALYSSDQKTLYRMSVAPWTPSAPELVFISVKMYPPRRGEHAPASEQDLERFRSGDAGAQVAAHRCGRALAPDKIDA